MPLVKASLLVPPKILHTRMSAPCRRTQTLLRPAHRYCGDTTGIAPCRTASLSKPTWPYSLRSVSLGTGQGTGM